MTTTQKKNLELRQAVVIFFMVSSHNIVISVLESYIFRCI